MAGVNACISRGGVVILRRKFSVRSFVPDCVKYKVTTIQYIGELCRYLMNTPVDVELEKQLKIKYAFGNGMVSDIWTIFQERYHIQYIKEFYGGKCVYLYVCVFISVYICVY